MKVLEAISNIAGKYFAFWVICIATIAYFIPAPFLGLNSYITILLGVVMFGMGLTLKAVDFKIIATKPLPVIIGVCAQFIIMPLVAYVLAYVMNLPAELAAGLVLLGSVGGTASNVMVYLAKELSAVYCDDVIINVTSTNRYTSYFTITCRTMDAG